MNGSSDMNAVQTAVSTVLEDATAPLYLVRPSAELLDHFITQAIDYDAPPLHVVAAEPALKAIRNHFPRASQAADLVETDRLTLTSTVPEGWGTAVVTGKTAYAFAQVADHELVFETVDVPTGLREICAESRDTGERFGLRTPSWSTVTTTLTDTFPPAICADFETMIEGLDELPESEVNEVDSALLVGAGHELLLYDLSQWAEDIQLSSKASLSRAKSDLEELGVVTTEKVPIDVGRPRQRLLLTDAYATLSEADLLQEVNSLKRE